MKLKKVAYGRTFNLGDFESERIDAEYELEDGDSFEHALDLLKEYVISKGDDVVQQKADPYIIRFGHGEFDVLHYKVGDEAHLLTDFTERLGMANNKNAFMDANRQEYLRALDGLGDTDYANSFRNDILSEVSAILSGGYHG